MEIGQKLKDKRTETGLSQEALAEKIGVSRQTISSWENNRSYPDIGSILKLSDLYNVSLDELLKEDANMRKHVEQTSAFHERLWNYLFILTIMLIPLAMILEQCLMAVTAARILTAAAMVIMPFLLNARHQILGKDKAINFVLVVVWIAIGFSGAYFLVFGWILIYDTWLNKKGASFWLAVGLYFAVPIAIVIGQRFPQFLEEGIYQDPPQLFGQTYRTESGTSSGDACGYTMVELDDNGNRLILDGVDMGYMKFEEAETGSSSWGTWHLIPNENCPLEYFTIEVDRNFDPQINYLTSEGQHWYWENLYPIPEAVMAIQTDLGDHSLVMDWYSAQLIPENGDSINAFTLTGQGSASIHLAFDEEEEPVTQLIVMEEYYHAGQVDIREYTLQNNGSGLFTFPRELGKRYDGEGQYAIYSIAWEDGEYLFRLDFQ